VKEDYVLFGCERYGKHDKKEDLQLPITRKEKKSILFGCFHLEVNSNNKEYLR